MTETPVRQGPPEAAAAPQPLRPAGAVVRCAVVFGFIFCWVIAGSFFTTALTETPGHWVPWACAALTAGLTAVTLTRLRWTAALVLSGPAAVLLSWFALAPLFLDTII